MEGERGKSIEKNKMLGGETESQKKGRLGEEGNSCSNMSLIL